MQEVAQASGRSTGKIILMGEHAVVYGEPAIALPFSAVEVIATVTLQGSSLTLSCQFYEGLVHQMPKVWESLKHAIRFSLYRIGAPSDPGIHIRIESTIPAERGMGSSAAVAVAVARSLFAFYGKELNKDELWEIVQSSETIAHGNPSGIDTATTTNHSPIFFVKGEPIHDVNFHIEACLVVADTGKTGNTLEAIAQVSNLLKEKPQYQQSIKKLGQLTVAARQALENNQSQQLGELMTQAHGQLHLLGVSDSCLDTLVTTALDAGALGAKMTGGGQGGCMIALALTKQAAEQIAGRLIESGASQTWIQELGE